MIQIIHIEGKRKGDIEDFHQNSITLGRHPDCDVIFPQDALFIARQHAKISHERGKYVFTNYGSNGSAVNGVHIDSTILHSGDVITLTVGGPKISFLCKTSPALETKKRTHIIADTTTAHPATRNVDSGEFTLQYGSEIKGFNTFSVSIGQHPDNDFAISHPTLAEFHVKLIYLHPNYYLKDLNQVPLVKINQKIVAADYVLRVQDVLSLTQTGPQFRYLGDGKFAEINRVADR